MSLLSLEVGNRVIFPLENVTKGSFQKKRRPSVHPQASYALPAAISLWQWTVPQGPVGRRSEGPGCPPWFQHGSTLLLRPFHWAPHGFGLGGREGPAEVGRTEGAWVHAVATQNYNKIESLLVLHHPFSGVQ